MKNSFKIDYEKNTLKETVLFLILTYIYYYTFGWLLSRLFKSAVSDEEILEVSKNKQRARSFRNHQLSKDLSDPMTQFQLRFIEDPDKYKGDSENEVYQLWFEEWKAGNILDSDLRWAPSKCFEDEKICSSFLQYMKIQLSLHKKSSFICKYRFKRTLQKFYPELSSDLKGLESDLSQYEIGTDIDELVIAAEKYGLSKELAQYVANIVDPEKFKNAAQFLKKYEKEGYEPEVCIYALENGLSTEEMGKINSVITTYDLPIRVGVAYACGALLKEDIVDLFEELMFWKYGPNFELVKNPILSDEDEVIEAIINTYLKNNRAAKFTRS